MNQEEGITIDREIYNHLPPEIKLDALLLKKLGRLTIQDAKVPAQESTA